MVDIEAVRVDRASFDALCERVEGMGSGPPGVSARVRTGTWSALLLENPFVGVSVPSRVWLAHAPAGVVGWLLGVPFRGCGAGQALAGHWGVDLFVEPAYRGRGVGTALLRAWRDMSPLALGLGITDDAFRLELSLGWRAVPLPPRLVLALTPRGFLSARGRGGLAWRGMCGRRGGDGAEVTVSSTLPRGIDDLYRAVAPTWPFHVSRTEAAVRWRYGRGGENFTWIALRRHGVLTAVAVVKVDVTRWRKKLWIHELLVDAATKDARYLVAECVRMAQLQGVDLIETRITAKRLRAVLIAAGFRVGRPSDRFIVHATDPDMENLAPWKQEWHLTLGDSGNL